MRATPELERFIRQTLGCGCPDAVFESVRIRRAPLLEGDAAQAWWIEVGGRLLIAVCDADPVLAARLAGLFDAARAHRDAHGFNRFRLVVASEAASDRATLEQAFATFAALDDRQHLHLVSPTELPPLTVTENASA